MVSRAMEYSCTYALRDVMTLMVCGRSIEEALEIWSKDDGAIGMQGECDNVIVEVQEEFWGYDDYDEDYSEEGE